MNITQLSPSDLQTALAEGLDPNSSEPAPLIVQAVRARRADLVDVLVAADADTMRPTAEGETAWAIIASWHSAWGDDEAAVMRALGRGALETPAEVLSATALERLRKHRWTVPTSAARGAVDADLPMGPVPLMLSALSHPTDTFRWYDPWDAPYPTPLELTWDFELMRDAYPEYSVTIGGRVNPNTAIIGCHSPAPGLLLMDLVASAATANPFIYRFDSGAPHDDIGPTAEFLTEFLEQLTAAPTGADWFRDL